MSRWLIRAAVSGIVVAILLSIIPFGSVVNALKQISVWTWSVSVVIFFTGHYLNAIKLRLLLAGTTGTTGTDDHLTAACVRAQYAGLVANLGLPGLAGGDLVRGAYLVPLAGFKRVAMASVADRVLDTVTMLVLIGVALPLAGVPPIIADVVGRAGLWIGAGAVAGAVALVVVTRHRRFKVLSAHIREAWTTLTSRGSILFGAVAISFVVQSAFVMTNVWLARQVGVTTGLAPWFVAWPMSKLIAILPISLGGIGVREAALVSLLAPYGAPREAVLASGILWQAVLIVTGLAGLIVTQLLPRRAPAPAA